MLHNDGLDLLGPDPLENFLCDKVVVKYAARIDNQRLVVSDKQVRVVREPRVAVSEPHPVDAIADFVDLVWIIPACRLMCQSGLPVLTYEA